MKLNVHLEAIMRILGLFITTFFTTKWSKGTNPPMYDVPLSIIAAILAIFLNYV
jgi:hypothetical protein